ncbi:MAG: choice-of-anchor J domain-containing protein [Bacteroidales bacterium]|nr:choice-of-anchor J domain-containing protein [Bacteroidales bacterium]
MKKLLLSLATCAIALSGMAALVDTRKGEIPSDIDPLSLQRQFDPALLADMAQVGAVDVEPVNYGFKVRRLPVADWVGTDTIEYFAAAQTYYKNYSFTYGGGDVKTSQLGVAFDGDKVTLTNLFNLYDPTSWSVVVDLPIEGTYDASTGTITVPTLTSFNECTVCANIWNYYVGALFSGTVNSEGKLYPADALVFNYDAEKGIISTNQAFGISEFTQDGSANYGFYTMYRSFIAALPQDGSNLVKFNDIVEYGETFPNTPVENSIVIVNLGNDATDYVIETEADDDAFVSSVTAGTIAGQSQESITYTFSAANVGDYEGLSLIQGEENELTLQLAGTVIPFPDFSGIVETGEFDFSTNIEYPFRPTTLADGTQVARTSTDGSYGSSELTATFTVPEGKIGLFSCKGYYNNTRYGYDSASGIFVDNLDTSAAYTNYTGELNYEYELAPGTHVVRIQHDQNSYTGNPEDYTYVYGYRLDLTDIEADAATLETPTLEFGKSLLVEGEAVTATLYAQMINKGSNKLTVTSITSDNDEFSGVVPNYGADLLSILEIPINFKSTTIGQKEATLTISTNAGDFQLTATAEVLAMPDFSQIVTEGAEYFYFDTDPAHPFIVEDGKAYNASSKELDAVYTKSYFTAYFTVPEGKMGYLSWDGTSWGTPSSIGYYDYGGFNITHPMTAGSKGAWGEEVDAGSYAQFESDSYWSTYLCCIPGDHSIEFYYIQGGDNAYYGEDRMEISNLKLHVVDFLEDNVELLTPEVEFESTYVGPQRYTTATIQIRNTGSNRLYVEDIPAVEPFYGVIPSYNDYGFEFNSTVDITLWFYPTEEGDFTGDLTIKTSGGDVTVTCHGSTKSLDGIVYPGDFEDAAYGWGTYDADLDGDSWNLGTNMWYADSRYVHSGMECLASASYSYSYGNVTPDNWTISPAITIPTEGVTTLSYYIAAFSPYAYAEHYSFYISEDASSIEAFKTVGPEIEETIDESPEYDENGNVGGWLYREVDLTPLAGKTIYLAFRHHDCTGQYLIRLDDVFVTNDKLEGINDMLNGGNGHGILRQEIYTVDGKAMPRLQKGVNIVVTIYDDGTRSVSKLVKK